MNVPNFLSLLRIILVPVIIIFLIQESYKNALITFAIAGLTDVFDGIIARAFKSQTKIGAFIDPLADKLLVVSSFIALSILGLIPAWLTVIVITRDLIITGGILILSLMSVSFEMKPAVVSKITTVFQVSTILLTLLYYSIDPGISYKWILLICWATAIFTVASGAVYITRGINYINRSS
ncbi:MAG TPA: CDP-diacylglycerol--glycerol-3-phosphate 3-phosphatidyltransferase [Deltaproteobacteria bacterium]|nr:CDP-diacylglycerol--glycerol-3-phosphate 3-phosphatidyltransferase [Deltaproteobacteria bacterium]